MNVSTKHSKFVFIYSVVDRRSFGSRGVDNSSSDCCISCSRPKGIFVNEWVVGQVDFC